MTDAKNLTWASVFAITCFLGHARTYGEEKPAADRSKFEMAQRIFIEGDWEAFASLIDKAPPWSRSKQGRALIAEYHYARCRRLAILEDVAQARAACERAGRNVRHPKASAFLQALEEQVESKYFQGVALMESNPKRAIECFGEVTHFFRYGEKYHRKATLELCKLNFQENCNVYKHMR